MARQVARRVVCTCHVCGDRQRSRTTHRPDVEDAVEMLLAGASLAEAACHVGLTKQRLHVIVQACYGGLGALRRVLGVRVGS
jgi:hypothetical protein